ncbi:16S rRNA (cytosine(1402)-N(4))-methyltransferase RsmH [Arcanobacterium pinnipediorum]|uniref:Ribosomal RNA small subunit methyltransferase H n=1 Tax=Arcanobacterium pinnipediorum TaxID=1503041 RepID=A0ABY5AJB1_9ACTO|nr:16S rRNA (cytosine(1402)-N(4))-methyltransferase RsmH [Arcanobacterium pinnipediorum]USR80023.1 16S rRNA (cytosine(1402)-N(4))-methyltransferase RsmH [Arcanobacterium pinnipediorum]
MALDAHNNALHIPVLLEPIINLLAPALNDGGVLIDCTLGMGGHSEAFLRSFPQLRVIGIDRDEQAIDLASRRLSQFGDRFSAVHTTYDNVDQVAKTFGHDGRVDAILMDLGVSSLQLDEAERGFSYSHDAPLDMRMDTSSPVTAAHLLATLSHSELTRILRVYGEEKFAAQIAREIIKRRQSSPIERTSELADLIRETIPAPARRKGGNPSKRTFQALRIAVNNELDVLEAAVPRAIESLRVGGRLAIESYQSLEDRIVKEALNVGLKSTSPPGLPMELEDHGPYLNSLTRGAHKADRHEQENNPRSASVRLRAVERLRPTPPHIHQSYRRQGSVS